MDYVPEIITASSARQNLYRLMDQTAEEHRPVVITGKRTNSVLVSEEDWNSLQETLYLTSIPGMVESIKKAAAEPLEKGVRLDDLEW